MWGVHTVYRARRPCGCVRELVWPSGKALGWLAEGPRFESASAPFSSKAVAYGHCLVTLSLTIIKH